MGIEINVGLAVVASSGHALALSIRYRSVFWAAVAALEFFGGSILVLQAFTRT